MDPVHSGLNLQNPVVGDQDGVHDIRMADFLEDRIVAGPGRPSAKRGEDIQIDIGLDFTNRLTDEMGQTLVALEFVQFLQNSVRQNDRIFGSIAKCPNALGVLQQDIRIQDIILVQHTEPPCAVA